MWPVSIQLTLFVLSCAGDLTTVLPHCLAVVVIHLGSWCLAYLELKRWILTRWGKTPLLMNGPTWSARIRPGHLCKADFKAYDSPVHLPLDCSFPLSRLTHICRKTVQCDTDPVHFISLPVSDIHMSL